MKKRYLTAREAAETLGITLASLYTYVSRGAIRSETIEEGSRERRYNAEDVQQILDRKQQRKNPLEPLKDPLHWGTPLLNSDLTLITDNGLYYRGQPAVRLAVRSTVEEVAALFWTGDMHAARMLFAARDGGSPNLDAYRRMFAALSPDLTVAQRIQVALTLADADDLAAYDLSPENAARTGARLMRLIAAIVANTEGEPKTTRDIGAETGIVEILCIGWCLAQPNAAPLLNAALILCADHELNASSFAARVVASTDASLYGVVLAGLAALQGKNHGGSAEQAESLLRELDKPENARAFLAERLRRGERIPGFGHRLYAHGDPRAMLILRLLADAFPGSPIMARANAIAASTQALIDRLPNLDFSLAALTLALDLPRGSALALFALGRTIGWIGHAIEQYGSGKLIRPRARYSGPPPNA